MKALWLAEISLCETLPNLLANTFEKTLKLQFIRLIGLNCWDQG
jgi:hypothetical protein